MNINQQVTYLMRGVDYGDPATFEVMKKELRASLIEADRTGKPLRVYCGYDPRTSDLHIGHTVTMRKLRQFQELGHQAIFLIGTYTALIGDPSDKDKLRPQLTPRKQKLMLKPMLNKLFGSWTKKKQKFATTRNGFQSWILVN